METKKVDAGRPEVLLYQSTREAKLAKLTYAEQWESAIELCTAEIKALGVERAQARGPHEQRFMALLTIPYYACQAHCELRMRRYDAALKAIDAIMAVEPGTLLGSVALAVLTTVSRRDSCFTASLVQVTSSGKLGSSRRRVGSHTKGNRVRSLG